jgi:cytochrome c oxidase assembly protein subunit 11
MPVFFYVDPEFASDWNCRNIHDITLSYVFHKVSGCDTNMGTFLAPFF